MVTVRILGVPGSTGYRANGNLLFVQEMNRSAWMPDAGGENGAQMEKAAGIL